MDDPESVTTHMNTGLLLADMRPLERVLHWFGFAFAHLLFLRAHSVDAVVRRLRLAYRLVGVRIVETETRDDTERTVFLCPYRNVGASRWGRKWLCHEKLDRVDDGYVTYLAARRSITYLRPQGCESCADCDDRYCYSEVSPADTTE